MSGNDFGATMVFSGIVFCCVIAFSKRSTAIPAKIGTMVVALSIRFCTQVWPDCGSPSQPITAMFRSRSSERSFRAFLAPKAIASFWATTATIIDFCGTCTLTWNSRNTRRQKLSRSRDGRRKGSRGRERWRRCDRHWRGRWSATRGVYLSHMR